MKTKELIKRLQEADPSGEIECCVGNEDILYVAKSEAYYDGTLQVLDRNIEDPFYNVTGARFERSGFKVDIHVHGIEDAIFENPDLPVRFLPDYPKDSPYYNTRNMDRVEAWREAARKVIADTEEWYQAYQAKKAKDVPK